MTTQFSLPSKFFKTKRQIKKMYHNSLKNWIFYQKKNVFHTYPHISPNRFIQPKLEKKAHACLKKKILKEKSFLQLSKSKKKLFIEKPNFSCSREKS